MTSRILLAPILLLAACSHKASDGADCGPKEGMCVDGSSALVMEGNRFENVFNGAESPCENYASSNRLWRSEEEALRSFEAEHEYVCREWMLRHSARFWGPDWRGRAVIP